MSTIRLRALVPAFVLAGVAVLAVGCRKKVDATTDAGDEAGAAASGAVDAAAAEATNEADITRFPDETKVDKVVAATEANLTNVRKAPVNGAIITTVPKNTNVTELAQKDKAFLVTFDDPKNASQKLMGWISKDAFTPTANRKPTVTNPCPAGQQLLLADQDFCGHVCKVAKDCPAGQGCVGKASVFGLDGKVGETVSTCSFRVDAGAPAVAAADAGGGGSGGGSGGGAGGLLSVLKFDAGGLGGGTGQTIAGLQQPPGANNTCALSFGLADDKLCHKTCSGNKDCPSGAACNDKHAVGAKQGLCFKTQ